MLLQFLVSWVAIEKIMPSPQKSGAGGGGGGGATLYAGMLSVLRDIEATFSGNNIMWSHERVPTLTGRKMKFPVCPVYMKSDISLTVHHQSCRG